MSSQTFRAQVANNDDQWHVYVVLLGTPVSQWPEHDWHRAAPAPTLAERERALAGMGYEIPPGAEWEWCESSLDPESSASPVTLIGTVTVCPVREVTG